MKYDVLSSKAEEFISHEEILETLKYAEDNKNNISLVEEILNSGTKKAQEKAKNVEGLVLNRENYEINNK